ncbi:MAG: DUF898 domain-containing protein [Deltaproteobacteria bacterium]|nr:DUF898 domain-containing protein [Deltaproteobacteria bacterium]
MTDTRYEVIYRGKILEGFEFETAKQNLMRMFSLSEAKAERILKSRRAVLKKNADEPTAKKLGVALKKAGLDVALTKTQPAMVSPEAPPLSGLQMEKPPEVTPSSGLQMGKAPEEKPEEIHKPTERAPMEQAGTPAPTGSFGVPSTIPFEFWGSGMEYFKIWIVNIILSIITLGIYSPWAKVRRKQYFYGNTDLKGASFEYLADPMKILKGRAIVAGFFIIYSIVSEMIPILGAIMSLAVIVILPWLVVRSLAFNARNSAIRNIRFGFHGSLGEAAKAYILWPVLAVLTLGLLSPYAYFKQKKFIVENSSYGTTRFEFTATAGEYYSLFIGALIPIVLGILLFMGSSLVLPPASLLVGLVTYLYLMAFFSVKTTNILYNSSRLGPHRLDADLEVKEYFFIIAINSIAVALTVGMLHPWAKVRTTRYKAEHLSLIVSGNLDSFVAQEQKEVSALGEEMADFLDFDFGL